jgi:Kef-type K+ transport system membrane component KefB
MDHLDVPRWLGSLALMLGAAKLFGLMARRVGQPAVLGELAAGVVLGGSVLGLVDPRSDVLHLLSEMGVVILLFAIGLETELHRLMQVGVNAVVVATVGVALPFALGYGVCRWLGLSSLEAVVAGASLTATSVGITARVLSDLGRLQDVESQIILAAAVLDDIVGLVILTVVAGLAEGRDVTTATVATTAAIAFGFVLATLLLGRFAVPPLFRLLARVDLQGTLTVGALAMAFGLAWLADRAGSAMIIGAFAAGLLLDGTPGKHEVERGITALGHFFVPLFFIAVGAAVDVRALDPRAADGRAALLIGAALTAAAVAGKFASGYALIWFRGRKAVIGAGMIPRGEVGLIFAQMGLAGGVLDAGLFAAVTVMVMVTTFLAPPLLKALLADGPARPAQAGADDDLITMP